MVFDYTGDKLVIMLTSSPFQFFSSCIDVPCLVLSMLVSSAVYATGAYSHKQWRSQR